MIIVVIIMIIVVIIMVMWDIIIKTTVVENSYFWNLTKDPRIEGIYFEIKAGFNTFIISFIINYTLHHTNFITYYYITPTTIHNIIILLIANNNYIINYNFNMAIINYKIIS